MIILRDDCVHVIINHNTYWARAIQMTDVWYQVSKSCLIPAFRKATFQLSFRKSSVYFLGAHISIVFHQYTLSQISYVHSVVNVQHEIGSHPHKSPPLPILKLVKHSAIFNKMFTLPGSSAALVLVTTLCVVNKC